MKKKSSQGFLQKCISCPWTCQFQRVCCNCCWCNCFGIICAGCACQLCCSGFWCCPKDELRKYRADSKCCITATTSGFGVNIFCFGAICCATKWLKDWSNAKNSLYY